MYIDAPAEGITLSKGLGSRHWAGAAISKQTRAIAVVVSQSSGTVRLFQNGTVVLHIEPFARPMIWQHFKMEATDGETAAPAVG
jgi:DNA integrity scanning protein DisA with diadenylate cyclase activity